MLNFFQNISQYDYLLYLILGVFFISIIGGIVLLAFWFFGGKKQYIAFYWGIGLILWNWSQLPTALALLGKNVSFSEYSYYFAITTSLAFFGRILIHLGLRSALGLCNKAKTFFWFFIWGLSFALYYFYFFVSVGHTDTRTALLFEALLFFVPLAFLSLYWLFVAFRNHKVFPQFSGLSLIPILLFCFSMLVNYGYFIYSIYIYPIELFNVLMRSSPVFILSRMLAVSCLVLGFFLMKRSKNIYEEKEDLVLDNACEKKTI